MMRMIGRKALGGVVLGMALAAFVGCGQGEKGGAESASQAVEEAASDVAAGVENAADAVGDSAAAMGAEAQDAAAAAGSAVTDTAADAAAG
ncbi:hypothetical protein K2X89_09000, partial [Myxococcota bacterium]|nr:hypothetical protein [Myxococcota bacterium]